MADSIDFSKGAAWVRGEVVPIDQASIGVTDWGFTRSDVVYDVVHVWDGAFFRLDDYLQRFAQSMAKMRLSVDQTPDEMRQIIHTIVASSGLTQAYVAMVASRGTPGVPGSRDPRLCNNHFFCWCVPFVHVFPPDVAARGAKLRISKNTQRIPEASLDPTAKIYHWGDLTQAQFEALDAGFDSGLLLDGAGLVTEGPGFNIFAVIDGVVTTPAFGALEGITRRSALEICAELCIACEVRNFSAGELLNADEVFATTTAGGPVAITGVDDRIYSNGSAGPMTVKIIKRYWDWHKDSKYSETIDYG